jgi:hypothetical protein
VNDLPEKYSLLREKFGSYRGALGYPPEKMLIDVQHVTAETLEHMKVDADGMQRQDDFDNTFWLAEEIMSQFKPTGSNFVSGVMNLDRHKRAAGTLPFSQLKDVIQDFDLKIVDVKEIIGLIDAAVFSGEEIKRNVARIYDCEEPFAVSFDPVHITGRPSEVISSSVAWEKFAALWREGIELLNDVIAFYTTAKSVYEIEIANRSKDADATVSELQKRAAKLCEEALQHKAKMEKLSAKYYAAPSQDILSAYSDAFANFQNCKAQYRSIWNAELPKITIQMPTLKEFPALNSEDVKLSHKHLPYHHCNTALSVY